MNRSFSLYLDFLRAFAATVVFLTHARFGWFSQGMGWLPSFGHEMVIIFFVLSGFVIAYTTAKGPNDWRIYASDRLSRIYSVVLPALLITACLDLLGRKLAPELYAGIINPDRYAFRLGLSAFFLQQSWTLAVIPGSNGPFWSLAYEFWYYAIFGLAFFCRRPLWLVAGTLAWLGILGWKIPMLLPVWLLGCGAFWLHRNRALSPKPGMVVALVTGALFCGAVLGMVPLFGHDPNWQAGAPLFFSGRVVVDLQLAILMAAHLLGMASWMTDWNVGEKDSAIAKLIRFVANRSFTLYLVHLPVLAFVRAVIPFDGKNPLHVALALGLAGAMILLVAGPIEHSRFYFRRWIDGFLGVQRPSTQKR